MSAQDTSKEFDPNSLPATKILIELDGVTNFLLGLVIAETGQSKTAWAKELIARTALEHCQQHDLGNVAQQVIGFATKATQE